MGTLMRNLWSAKVSTGTTPVEPLNLNFSENTHPAHPTQTDIDMEAGRIATGLTRPPTASPLGKPDAKAFSAPGALDETDGEGDSESVQSTPTGDCGGEERSPSGVCGDVTSVCTPSNPAVQSKSTLPKPPRRSESAISSRSAAPSITSAYDICRICHCEGSTEAPLISPCCCSGSLKYVHQKCLQQWIKSSQTRSCEVCRFTFIMETKVKPFCKWEKLDMSSVERRKILCSVTFHIVAITCVIWSLYVLIDRTAEEIRAGQLDWPFWTKLVVVAIGFTGGIVFMYVQCKMYFQLFRRWQSYNKVIYVQNGPAGGVSNESNAGIGKYVATANGTDVNGSTINK